MKMANVAEMCKLLKGKKKNNQERKKKNIAICDIKNSKGTNIRV